MDLLVNEFVYKLSDKYITIFEKNFVRKTIYTSEMLTFRFMIERYNEYSGRSSNVGLSSKFK